MPWTRRRFPAAVRGVAGVAAALIPPGVTGIARAFGIEQVVTRRPRWRSEDRGAA